MGLMQIMPKTWDEQVETLYGKKWGRKWADSPIINVEVGIPYLKEIDSYFQKTIPGYNSFSVKEKQNYIAMGFNTGPEKTKRMTRGYARTNPANFPYVRRLNQNES
jgi:hypothetical protein